MPLVNETNELGSTQSLQNYGRVIHTPNGEWTTRQSNIISAVTDASLVHHIVLDMSKVTFIDTVGAKVLKQVRMQL